MHAGEEYDSDKKEKLRELVSQKLKTEKGAERATDPNDEERGRTSNRRYHFMFGTNFQFYFRCCSIRRKTVCR